jgi:hypothetical protein
MRTAKAPGRRTWIGCLMFLAALFLAADARGQAIYGYTGHAFTSATGSYTTSDRVVASFTLSAPLPPSSTVDLASSMLAYSFSDGVQALTEANSAVLFANVTTDGSGQLATWFFFLFELPLTDAVGGPVNEIRLFSNGFLAQEKGARGTSCSQVTDGTCSNTSPGDIGVESGSFGLTSSPPAGPWTLSYTPSILAIPALGSWGLIALAAALGLLGGRSASRRA